MNRVRPENIVISNIINKYIKHSVSTATSKVSESLGWDEPGERAMKKIYDPNNGMSCLCEQIFIIGC